MPPSKKSGSRSSLSTRGSKKSRSQRTPAGSRSEATPESPSAAPASTPPQTGVVSPTGPSAGPPQPTSESIPPFTQSASSPKDIEEWKTSVCFELEILEALYSLDHEACEWCLESASKLSQVRPPIGIAKIPTIKTPEGQLLFGAKRRFLEEKGFSRIPPPSAEAVVPDFLNVHEIPEAHSRNNQPYVLVSKELPSNVSEEVKFGGTTFITLPHSRPGYNYLFTEYPMTCNTRSVLFDLNAVRSASLHYFIVVHDDSHFMKLLSQSNKSKTAESSRDVRPISHPDTECVDQSGTKTADPFTKLLSKLVSVHGPLKDKRSSYQSYQCFISNMMTYIANFKGNNQIQTLLDVGTVTTAVYFCFGDGNYGMIPSITGRILNQSMSRCTATHATHLEEYHMILDAVVIRLLQLCKEFDESIPGGHYEYFDIDKVVAHHASRLSVSIEEYFTKIVFAGLETFKLSEQARKFWDNSNESGDTFLSDGVDSVSTKAPLEYVDLHCPHWRGMSMKQLREDVRLWLSARHGAYMEKSKSISHLIDNLPKLIIILNEAHHLMGPISRGGKASVSGISGKPLRPMDWYRGFRGMFRSFEFYFNNLMAITMSTFDDGDEFGCQRVFSDRSFGAPGSSFLEFTEIPVNIFWSCKPGGGRHHFY
jgi:hypothetical protein